MSTPCWRTSATGRTLGLEAIRRLPLQASEPSSGARGVAAFAVEDPRLQAEVRAQRLECVLEERFDQAPRRQLESSAPKRLSSRR